MEYLSVSSPKSKTETRYFSLKEDFNQSSFALISSQSNATQNYKHSGIVSDKYNDDATIFVKWAIKAYETRAKIDEAKDD
ncbi:hypothetical protein OAQ99_02430 [Candidatus Kapabacteria bacterium]|nr:hypothetical protein [Candidatus Kapabacteria bacterium]